MNGQELCPLVFSDDETGCDWSSSASEPEQNTSRTVSNRYRLLL